MTQAEPPHPDRAREVLDVGYLEELAEHQRLEVPLGVVLHSPPGAFCVEVCPEDGMDWS